MPRRLPIAFPDQKLVGVLEVPDHCRVSLGASGVHVEVPLDPDDPAAAAALAQALDIPQPQHQDLWGDMLLDEARDQLFGSGLRLLDLRPAEPAEVAQVDRQTVLALLLEPEEPDAAKQDAEPFAAGQDAPP